MGWQAIDVSGPASSPPMPAERDERAVDADAPGARGMACERLDQLALEHLYRVR